MFREQFAGFLYAVDNAGCEFRFAKITAHGVRQFPPEDIPALMALNPPGSQCGSLEQFVPACSPVAIPEGCQPLAGG